MKNQFADASNMDVQEIERQRDTWRAAYLAAQAELEAGRQIAVDFLEEHYWFRNAAGAALAAWANWKPRGVEKADG